MTTHTIQGHWKAQGFMVRVSNALWATNQDQAPVEYRVQVQRLNFTKLANGGDWECSISFGLNKSDIELLYENGVGKFIEIFDTDGLLFVGVINKINAVLGTFSGEIGKLLGVDNKVKAIYSSLDTTDTTDIVGVREETDWYQDTDSQNLYGVQERILSVGGSNEDEIDDIVQSYLAEAKFPETNERVSIGESNTLLIDIEIVGLAQFFNKYTMVDTNTGTQNASDKIISVLNSDPNSIFSTDQTNVIANTFQVSRKEDQNRTAWQVLKSVYSKGDLNQNRWIFGIDRNKKAYYKVIPSDVRYEHKISERDQAVFDSGTQVNPWRIEPGYWLKISDFLVGSVSPINPSSPFDLREDKRIMFIEEVSFRFPYSVSLRGGKTGRTAQVLAQAGLAGIG